MTVVSFATFVLSSPNNVLEPRKAFVSITLFNIISFPISMMAYVIGNVVQAHISFKRIQTFLLLPELDNDDDHLLNNKNNYFSLTYPVETSPTLNSQNECYLINQNQMLDDGAF